MATRGVPFDGRDQADLAEEYYNNRLRVQNRAQQEEILSLKGLLRTHGIPWSPKVALQTEAFQGSVARGQGRMLRPRGSHGKASCSGDLKPKVPHLPMEVQLRIMQYALMSNEPIIDPLSKLSQENITVTEKTVSENQLAIGLLATCRAFHTEGTKILWSNNSFIFTSHEALRNFANLDLKYREAVKHINLRIIAQYYDDEKPCKVRKAGYSYHPSLKSEVVLKVHQRHKESPLTRKGFRSYTWTQVKDFLDALLPPYYPGCDKAQSRPRLLPNIETMRIDFVNFFAVYTPHPDHELHESAGHDHGCTLKELMITGLPCTEAGLRGGAEVARMVRDNGLFLDGGPAFLQLKTRLKSLPSTGMCLRVTRAWRDLGNTELDNETRTGCYGMNPRVPDEPDAPKSTYKRPTVWKQVPINRDSTKRQWVEFDKKKGLSVQQMEDDLFINMNTDVPSDEEDEEIDDDPADLFPECAKCNDVHPLIL